MKKYFTMILILIGLLNTNVLANSRVLKISIDEAQGTTAEISRSLGYNIFRVKITSLDDKLVVKKIKVNKGHCEIPWKKGVFPKKLAYSDYITFAAETSKCEILSIDVYTNKGLQTWETY